MTKPKRPERFLFILTLTLIVVGFFVFASASLGQISRDDGANFVNLALKRILATGLGLIVLIVASSIHYTQWKKYALPLFAASIILTALVFVPGIGFAWGGAARWIHIGPLSFQPADFLKFAFVLYLAAWFATRKEKVKSFTEGFLPFCLFLGIVAGLLLAQPDTGTFLVGVSGALAVFIVGGGRWKHLFLLGLVGIMVLGSLAYMRPYVRARLTTFLNPTHDVLGSSYQINQSLIAIGSGGLSGRGFGQSVQKFNFLPEPIGDSIFAVASEEFGLIGSSALVVLFLLFGLWGLKIASQVADPFGRTLMAGLVCLIVAQSFINMGAMLGVLPLTGVPLVFVSHGGTALLFALLEAGIILNISRYRK